MSNDILGVVSTIGALPNLRDHLERVARRTPLGLSIVEFEDLQGTLDKYIETLDSPSNLPIQIGDAAGKPNATYLVDGMDYVEGSHIGLPTRSEDRLKLLDNLLHDLFSLQDVVEVDLAIMDCSQLDEVQHVALDEFLAALTRDMEKFAPPDTLYRIRRAS